MEEENKIDASIIIACINDFGKPKIHIITQKNNKIVYCKIYSFNEYGEKYAYSWFMPRHFIKKGSYIEAPKNRMFQVRCFSFLDKKSGTLQLTSKQLQNLIKSIREQY